MINKQLDEFGEDEIKAAQEKLNRLYDTFTKKYGLLNSQTNGRAFRDDAGYCLLCSLEVLGEDGTLKRKADMFHKRTIKRQAVAAFAIIVLVNYIIKFSTLQTGIVQDYHSENSFRKISFGGSISFANVCSVNSDIIFSFLFIIGRIQFGTCS